MKHFKVGDYVNVGAHVREVSEDKKKVVVEVDGAYMRLSAALVWNPDAESAEPSKPTEGAHKHAWTGSQWDDQMYCKCGAVKLENGQIEGAQESMNAEQFWKHKFPNMVDEAGVCEFAEAYASERVAQLEKQLGDSESWAEAETRRCNELVGKIASLQKQVEGLRAALRDIRRFTEKGYKCTGTAAKNIILKHIAERAEAALATQLPTAPQDKP